MKQTEDQLKELKTFYPGLYYEIKEDYTEITGMLDFKAEFNGITIEDVFDVKIVVLSNYPQTLPMVWESGERIPDEYHKLENNALCLGSSLGIRMGFNKEPSLYGFVNNILIPYLYSYCYKQEYGEMPFGELSHGPAGILEYYCEIFKVDSNETALDLIKIIVGEYRGHHMCPCGSGLRLRNCHGTLVRNLKKYTSMHDFKFDLYYCENHLSRRQ
jgi:hypothetical protein